MGFLCFRYLGALLCRVSSLCFEYCPSSVEICSIRSYALLCCGLKSRLCDKRLYGRCAGYTAFIWILYPVCWGLSEGANVLSVDHEMLFYGILDLFAGPFFFFVFLAGLRGADYNAYGLQSGKASDYVDVRPPEKSGSYGENPA